MKQQKKLKAETPKAENPKPKRSSPSPGWRAHQYRVRDWEKAKARLSTCPMPEVTERMAIVYAINQPGWHTIEWKGGLFSEDAIACAKWIISSIVPDERDLSPEWSDKIFAWVRGTV